jgi:hypothetical protein
MSTSPQWRDKIAAVVPATVDTAGACKIVGEIEGREPSKETLRRWPIRYRLPGRIRVYEVDDVIAYARKRFEQAPVRVAAAARRKLRPGWGDPPAVNDRAAKTDASARTEARRIVRTPTA